jgi:hypothetical protein
MSGRTREQLQRSNQMQHRDMQKLRGRIAELEAGIRSIIRYEWGKPEDGHDVAPSWVAVPAEQKAWKTLAALVGPRPSVGTPSAGCGCVCNECIRAGLTTHTVCFHKCALQRREATPQRASEVLVCGFKVGDEVQERGRNRRGIIKRLIEGTEWPKPYAFVENDEDYWDIELRYLEKVEPRTKEATVRCWRCKQEVPEDTTVCNAGIGTQCKDAKACRGRWYGPAPRPNEAVCNCDARRAYVDDGSGYLGTCPIHGIGFRPNEPPQRTDSPCSHPLNEVSNHGLSSGGRMLSWCAVCGSCRFWQSDRIVESKWQAPSGARTEPARPEHVGPDWKPGMCESCETRPASKWCNGCIVEDHEAAQGSETAGPTVLAGNDAMFERCRIVSWLTSKTVAYGEQPRLDELIDAIDAGEHMAPETGGTE